MNTSPTSERVLAIHEWYARNVLPMRRTPEVERLWFDWLKAGYNGHQLRAVVLYIRRQISLGKRNEGALKLSNLLARSESGFLRFDEDLALARARGNLSVDRRLDAAPETEPEPRTSRPAHPAPNLEPRPAHHSATARDQFLADLRRLKQS